MVMGNAYQKQHTLIYDQILRREKKSEALEHYPEDVIHCHETFIQKIRESSEAKVEVIHGVRVQKWMNKRPSYSYDMLPLWGDFEGASIALEHESNFKNVDAGHRYRRILVFVYHPNRLFYRNEHESVEQDRLITVAAKIAQVEFVERYYKNEIWKELVPVDFRNRVMREQYRTYQLDPENPRFAELPLVKSRSGPQDLHAPDETPISISDSRILLDEAFDELSNGKDSFQSLTDFPPAVQSWLKKHKRVLFEDTKVISSANIVKSYNQLADIERMPYAKDKSLSHMISALMHQQKASLATIRRSQVDGLVYYSILPGAKMELRCSLYSEPSRTDVQPRWSINRPDFYVAYRRVCKSEQCQGKQVQTIPKEKNMRWTVADSEELQATHSTKPIRNWTGLLITDSKQLDQLPCPVETWCIHCKDDTKTHDNGTRYIDDSPQWAPGDPVKYVEKRTPCSTCPLRGRTTHPRFVPVDPLIPSIPSRHILRFQEKWKNQPEEVIREMLIHQQGAIRKPRRFKARFKISDGQIETKSEKEQLEPAARPLKKAKLDEKEASS